MVYATMNDRERITILSGKLPPQLDEFRCHKSLLKSMTDRKLVHRRKKGRKTPIIHSGIRSAFRADTKTDTRQIKNNSQQFQTSTWVTKILHLVHRTTYAATRLNTVSRCNRRYFKRIQLKTSFLPIHRVYSDE